MEATTEEIPKENTATTNDVPSNNINTTESSTAQTPQEILKKTRREERLKVDKNVEQFMKSLNAIPTMGEKFTQVCKKYAQTSDENRRLHFFIKQSDKRFAMVEKERVKLFTL